MRKVSINPKNTVESLVEIQRASYENDTTDIGQAFKFDAAFTQQLQLIVSAPTLSNTNQVLASLIQILQRGGVNRTT